MARYFRVLENDASFVEIIPACIFKTWIENGVLHEQISEVSPIIDTKTNKLYYRDYDPETDETPVKMEDIPTAER